MNIFQMFSLVFKNREKVRNLVVFHDFLNKIVNERVFFNKIHGFIDKIVNKVYNKSILMII